MLCRAGYAGDGAPTSQNNHKLLQQVEDLLNVHQVLGLQTPPEEEATELDSWCCPAASLARGHGAFCLLPVKLCYPLQILPQAQGFQSQLLCLSQEA